MTPKSILYSLFSILFLALTSSCDNNYFVDKEDDTFDFPLDSAAEYILVLGDIQYYTNNPAHARSHFKNTMDWIKGMHKRGYQLCGVLQTGDVSNTNEPWQYEVFDYYTRPVAAELLYITVTGNHDYNWINSEIISRDSTHLFDYYNFPLTQSHVVSYFEPGRMQNAILRTQLRRQPFYIIALEFGASPEVLAWAASYVARHPNEQFLLLTHEFLNRDGTRVADGQSDAKRHFVNDSYSTPQEVWDRLVRPYDNVRCVLCGHNGFSVQRYDANDAGRLVPQILMNLQYLPNGGDGWIQVWQVPADPTDSIDVRLINARTNELYRDSLDEVFNYHKAHFRFML